MSKLTFQQYSTAVLSRLYHKHRRFNTTAEAYVTVWQTNHREWVHYREWQKKLKQEEWPNGKPLPRPEGVVLLWRDRRLKRALNEVGLSLNKSNSLFTRYNMFDGWVAVREQKNQLFYEYHFSHHHEDNTAWITNYAYMGGPWPESMVCPKCEKELPAQCKAFISLNILSQKLGMGD